MKTNKPQESWDEQIYQLIASVRTNGAYPAEGFVPQIIASQRTQLLEQVREMVGEMIKGTGCIGSFYDGYDESLKMVLSELSKLEERNV